MSSPAFPSSTHVPMVSRLRGTFVFGSVTHRSLKAPLPARPAFLQRKEQLHHQRHLLRAPRRCPRCQASGQQRGEPRRPPLHTPAPSGISQGQPSPTHLPENPSILSTPPWGRTPWCMWWPVLVGGGPHTGQGQRMLCCPPPPPPRLVPAVPGTASIELVCTPGVGRTRMGRAYLLLRLFQHPCPGTATSRTLSPPLCSWRGPMPGWVHAQGWAWPGAGGREIRPRGGGGLRSGQ